MDNKYIDNIAISHQKKENKQITARKIYFSYPCKVFIDAEDLQFQITNEISIHFDIPIYNIHVVGSSKIGYSPWKKRDFVRGKSDLDIAIIDSNMFKTYMEITYRTTKNLKDLTKFKSVEDYEAYKKYISNGIFRPDKMPNCREKFEWFNFFETISNKYIEEFKDINAGIYLSQLFFECKQSDTINEIQILGGKYDKI